jgi:DNA-binding transcriptional ArsR family regulator
MGNAADYRLTVERTQILDALRELGGEAKVSEIASLVGKTSANTSKLLIKFADDGAVQKARYGFYSLVEVVEVDKPTSPTSTTSTTSTGGVMGSYDLEDFEPDFADLDLDLEDGHGWE